ESLYLLPERARVLFPEVVREERDILAPLSERGQLDVEHVEAVVEILAKGPIRESALHVAVRGRDDANINPPGFLGAHGADFPALKRTEELHLDRERHLRDLVEEDRSAVGVLHEPHAVRVRSREGAANVPEQLALEELLGNRG